MSARDARRTLVVATGNPGKVRELAGLLAGALFELRALGELVSAPTPVVEDGATFAANATIKALAAARATGELSLADDSGLEVDALGGRPGVRSARFAGEHATDAENNAALVAALARSGLPAPYPARFRCVLAVADPLSGGVWTAEGVCEGVVTGAPRGAAGFGYDPHFVPAGDGRTMAELSADEKNALSHRARAASALRPLLAGALPASRPAGRRS